VDIYTEWDGLSNRRRMMNANSPMNLIMETDLLIGHVFSSGDLNAVHAQIRVPPSRAIRVFRVDFWKRDESSAVFRPTLEVRQLPNCRFMAEHPAAADSLWSHVPKGARYPAEAKWAAPKYGRIRPQFDQTPNRVQRIAK
jgi:hypothetical protein